MLGKLGFTTPSCKGKRGRIHLLSAWMAPLNCGRRTTLGPTTTFALPPVVLSPTVQSGNISSLPTASCALSAKMLMIRTTIASSNVQIWEKGTPTLCCYVSKPRMTVLSLRNSQWLLFVTLDISLMSYMPAFQIRLRLGLSIFKEEKPIGQMLAPTLQMTRTHVWQLGPLSQTALLPIWSGLR